jgi:hypothetical protein
MNKAPIAALGLLVFAAPAVAGIRYKMKTTVEVTGQDAKTAAPGISRDAGLVEVKTSGENVRIAFLESANPVAGKGAFAVSRDGGATFRLVDPAKGTYAVWKREDLFERLRGASLALPLPAKARVSDAKVAAGGEEDGGSIAAVLTKKFTLQLSFASQPPGKAGGKVRVAREEQAWTTTRLVEDHLGLWLEVPAPTTGDAELDKKIAAERQKIYGKPIMQVVKTTVTDAKKRERTVLTTRRVVEVEILPIPDSEFELPSDLREAPRAKAAGRKAAAR